jgi:hypothetical protein
MGWPSTRSRARGKAVKETARRSGAGGWGASASPPAHGRADGRPPGRADGRPPGRAGTGRGHEPGCRGRPAAWRGREAPWRGPEALSGDREAPNGDRARCAGPGRGGALTGRGGWTARGACPAGGGHGRWPGRFDRRDAPAWRAPGCGNRRRTGLRPQVRRSRGARTPAPSRAGLPRTPRRRRRTRHWPPPRPRPAWPGKPPAAGQPRAGRQGRRVRHRPGRGGAGTWTAPPAPRPVRWDWPDRKAQPACEEGRTFPAGLPGAKTTHPEVCPAPSPRVLG